MKPAIGRRPFTLAVELCTVKLGPRVNLGLRVGLTRVSTQSFVVLIIGNTRVESRRRSGHLEPPCVPSSEQVLRARGAVSAVLTDCRFVKYLDLSQKRRCILTLSPRAVGGDATQSINPGLHKATPRKRRSHIPAPPPGASNLVSTRSYT